MIRHLVLSASLAIAGSAAAAPSFNCAKAATPVYKLFGDKGIEQFALPAPGKPLINNRLGYLMHDGGHSVLPGDWQVFFDFMDKHMKGAEAAKSPAQ